MSELKIENTVTQSDEWCLMDVQASMISYLRPMPKVARVRVARALRRNDLEALAYAFPSHGPCWQGTKSR